MIRCLQQLLRGFGRARYRDWYCDDVVSVRCFGRSRSAVQTLSKQTAYAIPLRDPHVANEGLNQALVVLGLEFIPYGLNLENALPRETRLA
jgi:hypothetical protein